MKEELLKVLEDSELGGLWAVILLALIMGDSNLLVIDIQNGDDD